MDRAGIPNPRSGAAPPLSAEGLHLLEQHLEQLGRSNRGLQAELERCHRQLSAIFDITRMTAPLSDPAAIRQTLLDAYVHLFDAARVLLVNQHGLRRLFDDPKHPLSLSDESITAALAPRIEALRTGLPLSGTGGAGAPARHPSGGEAGVPACHPFPNSLLGRLTAIDAQEPDILIVLRPPSAAPFDQTDKFVSETVLVYGGHVVSHARLAAQEADGALETVLALANAIDARDAYTRGHSERVAWLAVQLGSVVGLSGPPLQQLEWAGLLHDVGKIGVPEAVLKKAEGLTAEEFALIQQHARQGYEVLRPVRRLAGVAEAVLYHHENWDGSGYPYGIRGDQIPWMARVLRICDTFDAMTSGRSYRNQSSIERTLDELERVSGKAGDPELTAAFVAQLRALRAAPTPEFRRRFGHALGAAPTPVAAEQPTLLEAVE